MAPVPPADLQLERSGFGASELTATGKESETGEQQEDPGGALRDSRAFVHGSEWAEISTAGPRPEPEQESKQR
jgi:hypothetical protein